jgi:hypothetical protein
VVYVLEAVLTGTPHYNLVALLIPFEHGPRPNAELAPNLGRNGYLTLGGQF